MKKNLKAVFSIMLALVMALAALPVSALPRLEAENAAVKNAVAPCWTVPNGYRAHDYNKCAEFLEQEDDVGIKNGIKLNPDYDPSDPNTWGFPDNNGNLPFVWTNINEQFWLERVNLGSNVLSDLCGVLDLSGCGALSRVTSGNNSFSAINLRNCFSLDWLHVYSVNAPWALDISHCTALEELDCYNINLSELDISGCTALVELNCYDNNLSELDVSSCTALEVLRCYGNNLSELDVSGCSALEYLDCDANNLSELDVSGCLALDGLSCDENNISELDVSNNVDLRSLTCRSNKLIELDVSNNTVLEELACYNNNLTELDLSNNPSLAFNHFVAEGNGYIGYGCFIDYGTFGTYGGIAAYPNNGAHFEGFYFETGELFSEGEFDGYSYYASYSGSPTGTIVARFSGGALPGDIDGSGSVSTADAITTLRLAMQLLDGSGMNTDAADMDGNGSITLADAILILRTAMGLA